MDRPHYSPARYMVIGAVLLAGALAVLMVVAFGADAPLDATPPINWLTVVHDLIAGMPAMIAATAAAWVLVRRQDAMHVMMNSRLTELVDAKTAQSRLEGVASGVATEKAAAAQRAQGAAAANAEKG